MYYSGFQFLRILQNNNNTDKGCRFVALSSGTRGERSTAVVREGDVEGECDFGLVELSDFVPN